jgi:hypothetical protein
MEVKYDINGELENVVPFNRQGAWIANHYLYYGSAKKYLDELKRIYIQYFELKKKLIAEDGEEYYCASPELIELETVIKLLCNNILIYSCMAIEGFINYYGVKRLGDKYYKRNIERIGISEKLQIVLLACTGHLCKKDEAIVKLIRNLFDMRNSLVHPKTREITTDYAEVVVSIVDSQEEIVKDLELFFKLFNDYDSGIALEYELLKSVYKPQIKLAR